MQKLISLLLVMSMFSVLCGCAAMTWRRDGGAGRSDGIAFYPDIGGIFTGKLIKKIEEK